MSQAPSMPMYWDAYLADTTHLSTEEHGAYLLLLAAMWRRNGIVPDDDKDNARIVGMTTAKWRKTKARLDGLIAIADGSITQKKLQKTWEKTQEKIEKNRANGAKGGKAKPKEIKDLSQANASETLKRNGSIPEPEPELTVKRDTNVSPKNVGLSFSAFWDVWPNRNSKAAAEKAWKKLSPDDREAAAKACVDWFSAWRNCHPEASPILPSTFLNNRRWEDEAFLSRAAPVPAETYSQQAMRMIREEEEAERRSRDFRGIPGFDEPKIVQFAGASR